MNEDAIARLASFERLADDAALTAEQKVALAISGWLVGANQATDNFQTAVSLAHVRDKILEYLREPLAQNRSKMAADLHDMEGASIERVAQMLKLMKPPLEAPKDERARAADVRAEVAGLPGEADVRYLVQLPPEYDPLRHYPTIVTLADAGVDARADDRLLGRAGGQGEGRRAAGPGDAARLHRDRRRLAAAASVRVRVLGPRASRRARRAARCVPAVLGRHRPRVSHRPRHRRRRGLGHRARASRSVGRRDSDRRRGR